MNPSPDIRRLLEVAWVFLKIGALSYGGPAIMGIMQTEIQEKRGWMTKETFLEGVGLVSMLPGPPAVQLSIYIGSERAGWRGGVLAGLCFMLPAFLILMALTLLYSAYGSLNAARDAFYGLGPVVLGIFAVAVWRLGKAGVKGAAQLGIAVAGGALIALTPIGIAPVLVLAACAGVAIYHSRKWGLAIGGGVSVAIAVAHILFSQWAQISTASAGPPGLWALALFFLQVGAFTFGGGITILAFVQEQVVNRFHWLTAQEFLDGLALGQLTPGPILMLAAYVGYRLAGFAGAAVSAGAIFLPAFVLMLSVVRVLRRLKELLWLKAVMKGITGAVIGVLAVSLARLLPQAAPDAFTLMIFASTIVALLMWRLGPASLMLGGAVAGLVVRARPLQRLKELI